MDGITGLPKPRLLLRKGAVVATAKKCLIESNALFKILESTDISTPLGKIYIAEVIEQGLVMTAGPNKGRELRLILNKMKKQFCCHLIIVDGAINRMAPMIETDCMILATGASRNRNIDELVKETCSIYKIFSLAEVSAEQKEILENIDKITLIGDEKMKIIHGLPYSALVTKAAVDHLVDKIDLFDIIFIPALVSEIMLKELNKGINKRWKNKTLIIKDPIKIITGGNPANICNEMEEILFTGGTIKVVKNIPIIAVSVNPFYPKYRYDTNDYKPSFLDREQLFFKMKKAVPSLIVDIKRYGFEDLIKTIKGIL